MIVSSASLRHSFCTALLGALMLAGCSSTATPEDDASSEEAISAPGSRTWSRITVEPDAKDVARECVARFAAPLAKAKSANPDIETITRENLSAFASTNVFIAHIVEALLDAHPAGIPVADVDQKLATFVTDAIVEAAGADGKVGESIEETPFGIGYFDESREKVARDLLRDALEGSPLGDTPMLDEWTRVERDFEGDFAAYRLTETFGPSRLRRVLGLPEVAHATTDESVVTLFLHALEHVQARDLDQLAEVWNSDSVTQRCLYEYREDGFGWTVLAIVDQRGFLYAFTIRHED